MAEIILTGSYEDPKECDKANEVLEKIFDDANRYRKIREEGFPESVLNGLKDGYLKSRYSVILSHEALDEYIDKLWK